jgi:hypothetical protein
MFLSPRTPMLFAKILPHGFGVAGLQAHELDLSDIENLPPAAGRLGVDERQADCLDLAGHAAVPGKVAYADDFVSLAGQRITPQEGGELDKLAEGADEIPPLQVFGRDQSGDRRCL